MNESRRTHMDELDHILYQTIDTLYQQNANQIRYLTSTNNVLNRLLDNLILLNRTNSTTFTTSTPTTPINLNSRQNLRNREQMLFTFYYPPTTNNVEETTHLTAEEIQQVTTRDLFGNMVNPLNEQCPIRLTSFLMEDMVLKINGCGHIFFENELTQWFQRNTRCPACRYNLHSTNSSSNTNSSPNTNSIPNTNSSPNTNTNPSAAHLFDLLEAFLDPSNPLFNNQR